MNAQSPRPPIRTFRIGAVSAAVWQDDVELDGRKVSRFSIHLNKRYRDKNGHYQDSSTLFPEDLPKACTVLQKAYEFALLRDSAEATEAGAADGES